ncbi:MAG TPA: transposase [Aquifex aeolicus]|nr:transposase [Aquifex aeolicus]
MEILKISKKRTLTTKISGKERKEKVRRFLHDLAHFRNILVILIRKYKELYGDWLLNQSILYGLLSSKPYSGKYEREFKKVLENILREEKLKKLLKDLKNQKEKVGNPHFVQSIIRQTVKDFRNFFKALKEFKKNPSKFRGKPNPPKPKKLRYLMNFSAEGNANTFEREENFIVIRLREGEHLKVKLPEDFPHTISSVRLKFFGNDLYVDVVYEQKIKGIKPKGEYRAGIDIGLDELLAVVSENPRLRSFIVSGKEIKSFNQWFNKERAKLQSQIDYLRNELKSKDCDEDRLEHLRDKLKELEIKRKILSAHRKRWMDTQMHRIGRKVVDILYETGHKVIYIGKSAIESKNGINLGKANNQNFVFIPFRRLINLIKYKAEEVGIEVIDDVDESYTSKTSPFVDIERVKRKKELRKGERKGNLFKDKVVNKVFHADLVGALNILRVGAKLLKLRFYEDLKTLFVKLCNPIRFKLYDFVFKASPESLFRDKGFSNYGLSPGVASDTW